MPEALDAGRTRVVTGASSLDALAVWLGCLGHAIEIESPPELVQHVARVATRLDTIARRQGTPIPRL